jgi:hypothetical protein
MELFAAIDAGRLVPLLERSPGCDPAFAAIVDRALAPEPAGRPGLPALREALARIAG